MRGDLDACELVVPATLAEALRLLDERPGELRPIAGGTDVMVLLSAGKLPPSRCLGLWGLGELRAIEVDDATVTIGALATYSQIQRHPLVVRELGMLARAASETGGAAIQSRGTLGGNVANASPAADSSPALLAYGASLELVSARGSRTVPYEQFHTGYRRTVLAPNELVARVRVPRPRSERVELYRKVGPRKAQAISKVCFSACADLSAGAIVDARVALGGVAPTVVRCRGVERAIAARDLPGALAALGADIAPIDDVRSTARYRRKVAENLLEDFLRELGRRVGLAV